MPTFTLTQRHLVVKVLGSAILSIFLFSKSGYKHTVYMVSRRGKFFFLVKCMNLRYIINFKVFGYSHPFRRKRQTKVNFRVQTCLFHVELFSMLLLSLCFMCTRIFDFVLHFWSQNMLIAASMHSGRLSRGRIKQLHLFKVSKSSKRLQKIGCTQNLSKNEYAKHGIH